MLSLNNILIGLILSASGTFSGVAIEAKTLNLQPVQTELMHKNLEVPTVPFYSQLHDIESIKWQKIGCGIASLAMIIDYYKPGAVSINTLLEEGISSGAYLEDAGWKHRDLVLLANKYGLDGKTYDFSQKKSEDAFIKIKNSLTDGPVIASVHYKLDPQNPIPHLIVVNGIKNDTVYYNDPADISGGKTISIQNFLKAWKRKYITIIEIKKNNNALPTKE